MKAMSQERHLLCQGEAKLLVIGIMGSYARLLFDKLRRTMKIFNRFDW